MTTAYRWPAISATTCEGGTAPYSPPISCDTQQDLTRGGRKLLDRFRDKMRALHYALATEKAYRHWILEFLCFHRAGREWRHPATLGKLEIEAFLTHLATQRKVSAKTQNQAFSAVLFLYKQVLGMELPPIDALRAKESRRLPVVLSRQEVQRLIAHVEGCGGVCRLMVELTYGAGLRLLECCRLRVKDVDFDRRQLTVREGKGDKDRSAPLPDRCAQNLRIQMARVRTQHSADLEPRFGVRGLAVCAAQEISQRGEGAGMAICLLFGEALPGPPLPGGAFVPTSSPRERAATRRKAGRKSGRSDEASNLSHTPTQLRHAPSGVRRRHPDRARVAWPQRRFDHDDLHARASTRRVWGTKPAGRLGGVILCRTGAGVHWGHHVCTHLGTLGADWGYPTLRPLTGKSLRQPQLRAISTPRAAPTIPAITRPAPLLPAPCSLLPASLLLWLLTLSSQLLTLLTLAENATIQMNKNLLSSAVPVALWQPIECIRRKTRGQRSRRAHSNTQPAIDFTPPEE